ncbi:MAG TPA: AMP-binding protein, partial [Treponemataceae bacterium]|nr:AMP-binding protein [Treponemataceae bacterium]
MEELFLKQTEFSSSDDFRKNYSVNVPENFNFSYDVLDVLAQKTPDAKALVWCNDDGEDYTFTYSEMKKYSDMTASFFMQKGIKKDDKVMLILKRRYEFWFSILALHKIGAVAIPATHMLTKDDLVYRNNAASVTTIVAAYDEKVMSNVEASMSESSTLKTLISASGVEGLYAGSYYAKKRKKWADFNEGIVSAPSFPKLDRKAVNSNDDIMVLYFTSGTTNHPKMVAHDFTYPLGHIVTAKYWQCVTKGGLHLTVADTGWAKAVWGKLYGQWICECAVFVYDYSSKFKPVDLLVQIEKFGITSFCAPPTIYRYLIQEDMAMYNLSTLKDACTAGEPLSDEVYNKFKAQTGLGLLEGFGQTETTLSLLNFKGEKVKPGSIGK